MKKNIVYNGFAFEGDEQKKYISNFNLYKQLKEKYKIKEIASRNFSENKEDDFKEYNLVYIKTCKHLHSEYKIIKNDTDLSMSELLLIFDKGNLCFGGGEISSTVFRVWED